MLSTVNCLALLDVESTWRVLDWGGGVFGGLVLGHAWLAGQRNGLCCGLGCRAFGGVDGGVGRGACVVGPGGVEPAGRGLWCEVCGAKPAGRKLRREVCGGWFAAGPCPCFTLRRRSLPQVPAQLRRAFSIMYTPCRGFASCGSAAGQGTVQRHSNNESWCQFLMDRDLTADFSTLLAGKIQLSARLDDLRNAYRNAVPFPHVIIDDLFPPRLLDPVVDEMTSMAASQWKLVETKSLERIRRMSSGVELGAAGTQLVSLLHSASFLYLLSEITGVWQLLPDPYLQGAGYASMKQGDFFNIHSDRNVAYDTGLTRRLAMIVFLNKSWDPKYNGQLQLWNHEATRCDVTIEPAFNRTVLFEVADPNYHGVPAPIECPADRSRKSFIVYYHTVGIDGKSEARPPRTSAFAPTFYREEPKLRRLAREMTPPLLAKAAKKLVEIWRPAVKR